MSCGINGVITNLSTEGGKSGAWRLTFCKIFFLLQRRTLDEIFEKATHQGQSGPNSDHSIQRGQKSFRTGRR